MKLKYLFIAILVGMLFIGCSKNDNDSEPFFWTRDYDFDVEVIMVAVSDDCNFQYRSEEYHEIYFLPLEMEETILELLNQTTDANPCVYIISEDVLSGEKFEGYVLWLHDLWNDLIPLDF